jgi:hypothetical protein
MKTLQQAISQAKKLITNRNKLDNCIPWKGLYIVWSPEEFDNPGEHYHTATEGELDSHFSGCKVLEFVPS